MGIDKIILLSAIFVPTVGAFLLPFIGRVSRSARNICALIFVLVPVAASTYLISSAMAGKPVSVFYALPLGFNVNFVADGLAVFMAFASSLIGAVIVLYSFGYISHYKNQNEYYCMVVLFLGSMMGLVFSQNLIFLYIFWEITGIASWRLIGFYREKRDVQRADKAFLVTVFGALLMLIGFIALALQTGSFDLGDIHAAVNGRPVSDIIVLLILCGILSKSATLPFHTWLPDAGVAPSPVTALLHAAVLVKIGVYVFARIFVASISFGFFWHEVFPYLIAASALISAGAALIETDMKRIIAYSTVSQIAFIFLGFSVGNGIGVAGALLYILMHGFAKGGLFLCAGIVEQKTHIKDITKLGGLIATMPVTAVSFFLCAMSVMGIPPFGGFFAKYMVIQGAVNTGDMMLSLVFIIGACLTILYLFRIFNMIFLGEAKSPLAKEGDRTMVISVAFLAVLVIAGGVFISIPSDIAAVITKQIFLRG